MFISKLLTTQEQSEILEVSKRVFVGPFTASDQYRLYVFNWGIRIAFHNVYVGVQIYDKQLRTVCQELS